MGARERLYEPAGTPDAMLCVGGGKTLYIGSLDYVDWHLHGAPVYIVGVTGNFRLRAPAGGWVTCRAAVIPAGVRHALDLGGDPLAVFYPEPTIADRSSLLRLGHAWDVHDGMLVGQRAEVGMFRELYEHRDSLAFAGEALDQLVAFVHSREPSRVLDPRLSRVVGRLDLPPDDLAAAEQLARAEGLSVSRFMHLFSREVGVPFRRYRIWNRLRAAMRVALIGRTLTEAAISAGFTDSAHFARLFRETFGVTPSYVFRKVARAGNIAESVPR
ncbi:MAG: AraC family transcriptional regulator [Betaproteobacteria bacterium]